MCLLDILGRQIYVAHSVGVATACCKYRKRLGSPRAGIAIAAPHATCTTARVWCAWGYGIICSCSPDWVWSQALLFPTNKIRCVGGHPSWGVMPSPPTASSLVGESVNCSTAVSKAQKMYHVITPVPHVAVLRPRAKRANAREAEAGGGRNHGLHAVSVRVVTSRLTSRGVGDDDCLGDCRWPVSPSSFC